MHRVVLSGLAFAFAVATARAEPPPVPYSPEREEYCLHYKSVCEQTAPPECTPADRPAPAPNPANCPPCSANFTNCMAEGFDQGRGPMSCEALFSKLRYLGRDSERHFRVMWTTNYLAHGQRWAAWTNLPIRRAEGSPDPFDLFGQGMRKRNTGKMEEVALRIRGDNQIMLSETYGPYEPVCSAGSFAVIYSGDSIEAFSFIGSY
jgi:hypothetical protein